MRRPALYSSSSRLSAARSDADPIEKRVATPAAPEPSYPGPNSNLPSKTAATVPGISAKPVSRWQRLKSHLQARNFALLWTVNGLIALLLAFSLIPGLRPAARVFTQKDIDAAVLKTLSTASLPSRAAKASAAVAPSVVRVIGLGKENPLANEKTPDGKDNTDVRERSVGTGVVITDKGTILTNLHVVQGADSIKVTFADGLESTATITGTQPENDLAVLQAAKIPDDLIPATMRSTGDLLPGDEVVAVGFPFGIGPSTSAGVISGLKRSFRSPEGKQQMSNLIQFDAAANPGNSGGPLVTMDGEVVGIVTAIYNPNEQRTFVGIGFAVPIENAASAAGMPPF
jgi:S1-C subfamily serine protease